MILFYSFLRHLKVQFPSSHRFLSTDFPFQVEGQLVSNSNINLSQISEIKNNIYVR